MAKTSSPENLLTLNQLAGQVGVSYPTALKLVTEGVIQPDATAGRMSLFKASKVEELRQTIRKNVRNYGYGYFGWKQRSIPGPDATWESVGLPSDPSSY